MKIGITTKYAVGLLVLAMLLIGGSAYATGPGGVGGGLVLWLDAQSLGLTDGGLVNTWADQSGIGNDATAYPWATWQPEFKTNQINGKPVVRFGTYASSQLKTASGVLSGSTMTAFMVYKDRSPAYGQGIINFGGVELLDWANGWGTFEQYGTWEARLGSPTVPNAIFGLQTAIFNGASSLNKLNGALDLWAAPYDGRGNMTYANYSIAGPIWIGARQNTTGVAPVDFAEIVIYNRVLTPTEENNVGAYLAAKYSLTTTYQTVPPPNSGVSGHVTNSAGNPVESSVVEVVGGTDSTATDSAGFYQLPLVAGTYTIKATKSGYGIAQQAGVVVNANAYTTLNLTLPPTPGIYGRVTASNLPGNPPVIGAKVRALGTSTQTYTAADGTYKLVLPSGTYEIEADKDHYGTDAAELGVDGGIAQTQNFSLTHDGTWDLATDYTTICNPAGQWSLGVVNETSNVMSPFTQQSDTNMGSAGGAPWLWSFPNSPWVMDTWAGAVGRNSLSNPIEITYLSDPKIYVEPGDITLYGGGGYLGSSAHNGITSIRWTAPDSRTIHIYLKAFSQTDKYLAWDGNTQQYDIPVIPVLPVSVRRNNVSMTVIAPAGFVGRAVNGRVDSVGPAPVATFATDIPVDSGDTIDFSLGQYGYGDLNRWTWNASWSGAGIVAQISPGNGTICNTIADLKARSVGDTVFATAPMQITSSTAGEWSFDKKFNASGTEMSFYIQSDDRLQGMKCLADASTTVFDFNTKPWKITFTGVIATDYLGQKVVRIQSINGAVAGTALRPLGKGSKALTNSNTLVKVWGKITHLEPNPSPVMWEYPAGSWWKDYDYEYITINDGGQDIKIPMHLQHNYMSSYDTTIANLAVGRYIAVTGIASTTTGSDAVVCPRNVFDIQDYTGM